MESKKGQKLPGNLFVVATPIGNRGDITLRALKVLGQSDHILCEDTRIGVHLFRGYPELAGRITTSEWHRMDQYSGEKEFAAIYELYSAGKTISLITDAGTPGLSDPGNGLVRYFSEKGAQPVAIPGASSLSAFISVAGFSCTAFYFHGFLPRSASELKTLMDGWAKEAHKEAFIAFESPHRLMATLSALKACEGLDSIRCVVGKEITKIHECFWSGNIREVAEKIENSETEVREQGEWILGFENTLSSDKKGTEVTLDQEQINKLVSVLKKSEIGAKSGSEIISQFFGIPKKTAYSLLHDKKD